MKLSKIGSPLKLENNTVHLWQADVNVSPQRFDYFKSLLSLKERETANRFKFKKDYVRSVVSRGGLRELSGRYLDRSAQKITFKNGKFGKPEFKFDTPLCFNVSHSGNSVVYAFGECDSLGVDVELVKDDFDPIELARNFFSAKEIMALEAQKMEDRAVAFYRCWTRKEAFIKAEGSGLAFPLNLFTVSIDRSDQAALLETVWDATERHNWKLFPFTPAKGYIGAVAVKGKIESIKSFSF